MHLEVKVALNFIVSYLYNKLPRRRADLFGEELERILVSRFEGHWYPEAPLRGSAFRCLHLGARRDPVVELAARRSGLDTEEVRANVPAELSVWMDPYEVSYQIGETGAVKVLYLEDPPGAAGESDRREAPGGEAADEAKSLGFNPEAQVFVPIGGQASPVPRPSLSCSPAPPSAAPPPCPALFSYPSSGTPTAHSSNPSTPSPPLGALSYLAPQQAPPGLPGRPPLQPITFTTASFAATKFGSTKMKKSGGAGPAGGSGSGSGSGGGVAVVTVPPPQRILSRSPPLAAAAPGQLLKHKPLALSLQALGPPAPPSQLSPNAKEFVFPGSPGALYFEVDSQPMVPHTGPFHMGPRPAYDPFTGPAAPGPGAGLVGGGGGVGVGVGGMSYTEKPPFGEGLGGYNLQYSSQSFQPVVLAN